MAEVKLSPEDKGTLVQLAVAAVLAFVAILALLTWVYDAHGHGDAAWIERDHPECCGPADCEAVPASAVRLTDAGWQVKDLDGTLPRKLVRPSKDGQWWACRYPWWQIRCLFRPRSMM